MPLKDTKIPSWYMSREGIDAVNNKAKEHFRVLRDLRASRPLPPAWPEDEMESILQDNQYVKVELPLKNQS